MFAYGAKATPRWLLAIDTTAVKNCLAHLDLSRDQAAAIFDAIDIDGSGTLGMNEFVPGIMAGRRAARCYDVTAVQCDIWRSQNEHGARFDSLEDRLRSLEKKTEELARAGSRQERLSEQILERLEAYAAPPNSSGVPKDEKQETRGGLRGLRSSPPPKRSLSLKTRRRARGCPKSSPKFTTSVRRGARTGQASSPDGNIFLRRRARKGRMWRGSNPEVFDPAGGSPRAGRARLRPVAKAQFSGDSGLSEFGKGRPGERGGRDSPFLPIAAPSTVRRLRTYM